jgi:hypothetical protein
MRAIYKFEHQGYYGELTGLFVEDSEFVDQTRGITFTETEKLGKYSEDEIDISAELKCISSDAKDVEQFEKLNLSVGYNPFNRIRELIEYEYIVLREGIYMNKL